MFGTRTRPEARSIPRRQAPCGFDAGDGDLYRYAGNDPTNATDPSGLKIYKGWWNYAVAAAVGSIPADAPRDIQFADQLMHEAILSQQRPDYAYIQVTIEERKRNLAALNVMAAWGSNKDIDLNIYYVVSTKGPTEFLQDATKKSQGSINLYFGHDDSSISQDPDVEKALKGLADGAKDGDPPLFGMSCCYASLYNGDIPEPLRVPDAPSNKDTIEKHFWPSTFSPMILAVDKVIKDRIKAKKKVEVNLYFNNIGVAPIDIIAHGIQMEQLPYDLSGRYYNWGSK